MRLVLGLKHARKRRRLEHRAVRVGATADQSGDVASHVSRARVDGGRSRRHAHALAIDDRSGAMRAQGVSRREARLDPFGSDQVGVSHTEGLEDVLAQVTVKRRPAHILDDLAECREPMGRCT